MNDAMRLATGEFICLLDHDDVMAPDALLEFAKVLDEDPATDLHAKTPHGDGQTILREAILIADHNAYHLGVLAVMARIVKSVPTK